MDELQVIALILEIIGFSLAALHIYKNNFSKKLKQLIEDILKKTGFYELTIGAGALDYNDDLEDEERENLWRARLIKIILLFATPFMYYIYTKIMNEKMEGRELFYLYVFIYTFQWIIALFTRLLLAISEHAGNGDLTAGIGFGLGILGMTIEAYQISLSSLSWTLWLIALLAIILIATIFSKRSKSD